MLNLENRPRTLLCAAVLLALALGVHAGKLRDDARKPREWHVSVSGDDAAKGSADAPFRHIGRAAEMALPGDRVVVHEGTYRERVAPPRGGTSASCPIVYEAAAGERVSIKGSEELRQWKRLDGNTWQAAVSNAVFGDFNPYLDTLHGDWLERGQWSHTGEVYIGGKALTEARTLDDVLLNAGGIGSAARWYAHVGQDSTWFWINSPERDPNCMLVEYNVRQSVFYPEKPFVNYITVRGFHICHAATPWAPPTAEQPGAIGTHWSKGWVIEDNLVTDSKCVGITLGKYGDEWDNRAESVEGYIGTTRRALDNGWDRDHVGSHTVRRNRVSDCGQAGIAGSLGAIFSTISDNVISDIALGRHFWGYELAGIKIHAAVDVVIEHNHIYNTEGGIWLDWMAQGTRVTRNFLHDNRVQDFSLEVNHGPILVDNNIFLSEQLAQIKLSQGAAFVHNLIAWQIWPTGNVDQRETPYLQPHATAIAGYHDCPYGDVTYLNNVFTREDLSVYEGCPLPVRIKDNLVDRETQIKVTHEQDGWYLTLTPSGALASAAVPLVRLDMLPEAVIPAQGFVLTDGRRAFDRDYLGHRRGKRGNSPGAFNLSGTLPVRLKVFDN